MCVTVTLFLFPRMCCSCLCCSYGPLCIHVLCFLILQILLLILCAVTLHFLDFLLACCLCTLKVCMTGAVSSLQV